VLNAFDVYLNGKVFAILMAAGFSRRFGAENKLLAPFRGKALARHTLDLVCGLGENVFSGIFFVFSDERVAALAEGLPLTLIRNDAPEKGQRESVRLGVEAAGASEEDFYFFFPCDQPLLDSGTVQRILAARQKGRIVEPRPPGKGPCSPSLFSGTFRNELLSLQEGEEPRIVKARRQEAVFPVEVSKPLALSDVDDPQMLKSLLKALEKGAIRKEYLPRSGTEFHGGKC
jgi:molybdenum cofactor cytidylyltransferase